MKISNKTGKQSNRLNCRSIKPSGRLWVENSDGSTLMSWARATILLRIDEYGSISSAAQSMGISYVKAWKLVKQMNASFLNPLVELSSGGARGGGAKLTDEGKQAADEFWRLVEDFNTWLKAQHYLLPLEDNIQTGI